MAEVFTFSKVSGQLLSEGKPVSGARVSRLTEYHELEIEETMTDQDGRFQFDSKTTQRGFTLFSSEFVVAQSIRVATASGEYVIWSNTKRSVAENSELGGQALKLRCNLQDGLKVFRDYGSILRTNCTWDSERSSEVSHVLFLAEYFDNLDWLKNLPQGLISETIDLRYHSVEIDKEDVPIRLYIGPSDPSTGGSGITIFLDAELSLLSYEIETISPAPKEESGSE